MLRLAALFLGCVSSAYTDGCFAVDSSRYSWYIKNSWRFNWHMEQPAVEMDLESVLKNDLENDNFFISDETYLIWTFDIDFNPTVTVNPIAGLNKGAVWAGVATGDD